MTNSAPDGGPVVVLAEDSDDDAFLIERAFAAMCKPAALRRVRDGQHCLDLLTGSDKNSGEPVCDLIVLDLKMPRVSGFEVLDWLRSHPEYSRVPIVVLSGSSRACDKEESIAKGAASFFTKPTDNEELRRIISEICNALHGRLK